MLNCINLCRTRWVSEYAWLVSLSIWALMMVTNPVTAQEDMQLTTKIVQQRLDALKERGVADDGEIVVAYEEVKDLLVKAQSQQREAAGYLQSLTTAPQEEADIQARIDALEARPIDVGALQTLSRPELETRLAVLRGEMADIDNTLDTLDRRLAARESNAASIRARLSQVDTQLESQAEQPPLLAFDLVSPPTLAEALQWRAVADLMALEEERRALDASLTSQPARYSAMAVARVEASERLDLLSAQVQAIEAQIRQTVVAAVDVSALGIAQSDPAFPLVADLADADKALRLESLELADRVAQERRYLEEIDRASRAVSDRFATARRVVEFAANSDDLGSVLLAFWGEMDQFRQGAAHRDPSQQTAAAVINQIDLEEELKQLANTSQYLDERLLSLGLDVQSISAQTRVALAELVDIYRERIRSQISAETEYIDVLTSVGDSRTALNRLIAQYDDFLKGLILWIPAYPNLWEVDRAGFSAELQALAEEWRRTQFAPATLPLLLIIFAAVLYSRRKQLVTWEQNLTQLTARPRDDAISHTLLALVSIALQCAPLSMLLWALSAATTGSLASTVLMYVAWALFLLRFLREICVSSGVGRVHFGWSQSTVERVYRELGWLTHAWLPFAAITAWVSLSTSGRGEAVITRAFILLLVLTPLVVNALYLAGRERRASKAWFAKPMNQIRLLLVAVCTTVALAVLTGHVYSVMVVFSALVYTACTGSGLFLLYCLLMRWLTVTRRRLRMQELVEARTDTGDGDDNLTEEPTANLGDLSEETSQLIRVGIFAVAAVLLMYIWLPLLPAFDLFSRVTLWTSSAVVDGQTSENRITLATLLVVLFLAGLTLYAARKLPALIDLVLRSRTQVSPSARYTTSSLVNYVILGGGIVAALAALGVQWSQLQWLVAALGVGIGFGLQEIIANFISGIIILFERPIRVGDVVSTGGTDGVVTKIRIRATTIVDWDGKELLVPNKEFITDRLLNWSLSDPKIRIVLRIGIAYGANVELAIKSLHEIVSAHPRVVEDPKPQVVFEEFGDNALLLSARCHLDSLDDRLGVVTALNREIYRRFAELDIVIAFPQRDVHIDAENPIRVTLENP